MKVAIIGCVGVPSKYGGFETLAHQLVEHLSEQIEISVFCSAPQYTKRPDRFKNAKLKYIGLNANGFQSIPYDMLSILRSYRENDILLILGVAGVIILPYVQLLSKVKVIVHIDGMEWKREKWKGYAKLYLRSAERLALKISDRIIADNQAILENIPVQFQKKTSLITYGGDHVSKVELQQKLLKKLEIKFDDFAFSVCRIVPENNIRTILRAFKRVDKKIVFVGNWYDSDYGISIWQEFHEEECIKLLNPIYNQVELDALRSNCSMYVHGHSAGGTNPSLVEAISLGLNIVCFDVSFNKETLHQMGQFFKDEESLVEVLKSEKTWSSNKNELSELAEKYYKWDQITKEYADLFNAVISN